VTSPNLERLARAGELKAEGFSARELHALIRRACDLLSDARRPQLSREGRFGLAYGAAHALATAALRLHGYRSSNRVLVFQCLEHTAGLSVGQCRLFCVAHERRNRAEYEGRFEVEEALLESLIEATDNLLMRVQGMAPP
jgi:hypothetical protein